LASYFQAVVGYDEMLHIATQSRCRGQPCAARGWCMR